MRIATVVLLWLAIGCVRPTPADRESKSEPEKVQIPADRADMASIILDYQKKKTHALEGEEIVVHLSAATCGTDRNGKKYIEWSSRNGYRRPVAAIELASNVGWKEKTPAEMYVVGTLRGLKPFGGTPWEKLSKTLELPDSYVLIDNARIVPAP